VSRREAAHKVIATTTGIITGSILLINNPVSSSSSNNNFIANAVDATIVLDEITVKESEELVPVAPILSMVRNSQGRSMELEIPRVGYSFYNTPIEQVGRCTDLALRSGIFYLDLATQYGSTQEIGNSIRKYLNFGRYQLGIQETPEIQNLADKAYQYYDETKRASMPEDDGKSSSEQQPKGEKLGNPVVLRNIKCRKLRRDELFLSHKLSNDEQSSSTDTMGIKLAIQTVINDIFNSGSLDSNGNNWDDKNERTDNNYLDLVSLHSPLTTKEKRLTTYRALVELQQETKVNSMTSNSENNDKDSSTGIDPPECPKIRAIGVCNYGIRPLQEILEAGLPLPQINQLEISPFNQHKEVVAFCQQHQIVIGCAAWSKLSGAKGPQPQWEILSAVATKRNISNAQLLVKWSLQSGYVCVPRSSSDTLEKSLAIIENSYGGTQLIQHNEDGKDTIMNENKKDVSQLLLTTEEMQILNGLDVSYKAGQLGRTDGWTDKDIVNSSWDPTEAV